MVTPIKPIHSHWVGQCCGHLHENTFVIATSFHQQNLEGRIRGNSVGQYTAGRASTYNYEIKFVQYNCPLSTHWIDQHLSAVNDQYCDSNIQTDYHQADPLNFQWGELVGKYKTI